MSRVTLVGVATAISVAMLGFTGGAWAANAKRMTYDEAWADCKKDVAFLPESSARYTRGAGCMKRHGYRLKKSSM